MSVYALQFNDANIELVADAGQTLYAEPAFAYLHDATITSGLKAFGLARTHPRSVKNKYLHRLNTAPLADSRFAHLSPADLLAEQLASAVSKLDLKTSEFVFLVPGSMSRESLGVLLGVARELGLTVTGLVDSAVAASRQACPGRQLLNLELGLHACVLSAMDQSGGAVLARSVEELEDCGMEAMRDRWLRFITNAFIAQSRFDPMHSAESEQLLLDQLDECLRLAKRQSQIDIQLVYQGVSYEASVQAPDLIAAVSGRYQIIADATRALSGAGLPIVLQLSEALNDLPGFRDYVCARSNADAIVLGSSAAGKGALSRSAEIAANGGQRLSKQLAFDVKSLSPVSESAPPSAEQPSHLLYGHRAIPISRESLLIGTGDEHLQVNLPIGSSGVSKRHCSLQLDGNSCVLSDHSRYGSFLNGKRVNGSAVLQAGDRLRVGTPGHEFLLIRVNV